jgi:hypothetical protein
MRDEGFMRVLADNRDAISHPVISGFCLRFRVQGVSAQGFGVWGYMIWGYSK